MITCSLCWIKDCFLGLDTLLNQYSKTCLKRPLKKKIKIGTQDQLWLNAGQKYCRMLQKEHSTILLTFIKLSFVMKIYVLSIFERPFKTGFTVVTIEVILNENCLIQFDLEVH